jgi:hypothetical protein
MSELSLGMSWSIKHYLPFSPNFYPYPTLPYPTLPYPTLPYPNLISPHLISFPCTTLVVLTLALLIKTISKSVSAFIHLSGTWW